MFSDSNTAKGEMYLQLHVDDGLKQILPYLVNWIQNEVSVGVICHLGSTDSENEAGCMLSYLEYLMHVTHSLVLNRHLNTVLYVVALPLSHTASPAPSMHSFLLCREDAE